MSGFWCFPDGLYTSFADSTEDMEAGEWKYLWFTLWSKRRTTGVRTAVSVIRSRRGIFWAVYSIWWIWGTFESGCFWCVSCQRDSFQFFWCLVFVWIDSDYFFGVLDLEEMWFGVTGHSGRQCWHCWRKLLRWWTADSHFSGLLLWWQGSPGRRKIRNMSKNGSGVLFERGVLLIC